MARGCEFEFELCHDEISFFSLITPISFLFFKFKEMSALKSISVMVLLCHLCRDITHEGVDCWDWWIGLGVDRPLCPPPGLVTALMRSPLRGGEELLIYVWELTDVPARLLQRVSHSGGFWGVGSPSDNSSSSFVLNSGH